MLFDDACECLHQFNACAAKTRAPLTLLSLTAVPLGSVKQQESQPTLNSPKDSHVQISTGARASASGLAGAAPAKHALHMSAAGSAPPANYPIWTCLSVTHEGFRRRSRSQFQLSSFAFGMSGSLRADARRVDALLDLRIFGELRLRRRLCGADDDWHAAARCCRSSIR